MGRGRDHLYRGNGGGTSTALSLSETATAEAQTVKQPRLMPAPAAMLRDGTSSVIMPVRIGDEIVCTLREKPGEAQVLGMLRLVVGEGPEDFLTCGSYGTGKPSASKDEHVYWLTLVRKRAQHGS